MLTGAVLFQLAQRFSKREHFGSAVSANVIESTKVGWSMRQAEVLFEF